MSNIVMKEPAGSSGKYRAWKYLGKPFYIIGPKNCKTDDDTGKVEGVWAIGTLEREAWRGSPYRSGAFDFPRRPGGLDTWHLTLPAAGVFVCACQRVCHVWERAPGIVKCVHRLFLGGLKVCPSMDSGYVQASADLYHSNSEKVDPKGLSC